MTLAHLCLGTASWNTETPYNDRVPPSDAELRRILDVAEAGGIRWLDTAAAYGNVERRLAALRSWRRFRIVTKMRPNSPYTLDQQRHPLGEHPAAMLTHLTRAMRGTHGQGRVPIFGLRGASVYTATQAMAAMTGGKHPGVQVLQVPWNLWIFDQREHWLAIRDRAYADGVLLFGRQPFNKNPQGNARDAFQWAIETNPRGWCVVGVESAAQLTELISWREALR